MNFNYKSEKVELDATGGANDSIVIMDDLHDTPFKNLTIWIRPESNMTYDYVIDYGGKSQGSGSASAGALTTYNDAKILPPNQPNANWSRYSDEAPYVVGLPINVTVTNTGASKSVFLISIISETFSQVI